MSDEYVLGTHDAELERLGLQHRLWSDQAAALWDRAGIGPGQTVLDLGCGPGYATLDLADRVGPGGRVLAIDESERFIRFLREQRRSNIDAEVGDVQKMGLARESLDAAYARWVLCFVEDPQAVVAEVASALRPGGTLAVQDYFNYASMTLAPKGPALDRVAQAVARSWVDRRGDPDVAGRLPGIMARCGLTVREIRPIQRVARPGSPLWSWPTSFFRNYVPSLVRSGYLTAAEQEAFDREWSDRSNDPDSFFFAPPMIDLIAVKGSAPREG